MFSSLSKKTSSFFFATFFDAIFFVTNPSFAWTGYDYDEKSTIEIEQGNLVREGLVIQFYDYNLDKYHAAKIIFVESVVDGTRIQIKDLDAKKERIFIMQPE
jgi:hypothetical protein